MKILVVSDTHGAIIDSVVDPMKKEKDIDLLIHCGDKYNDAEKLAVQLNIEKFYNVPGNCDLNIRRKKLTIIKEIEGKKVLITHGHVQHVKDDLELLKQYALGQKVDVVLYGHTHRSHNELIDNILYFNPGSTILPKDGNASYGVLEILDDKISSNIISISK